METNEISEVIFLGSQFKPQYDVLFRRQFLDIEIDSWTKHMSSN